MHLKNQVGRPVTVLDIIRKSSEVRLRFFSTQKEVQNEKVTGIDDGYYNGAGIYGM